MDPITITTTTLTITPPVGAAIVLTGAEALDRLEEILESPSSLYTYNKVTGAYTGTFSLGECCMTFTTTQANAVVTITVQPFLCTYYIN